ncbi:hypothetical protein GCM10022254_20680 [Actinomadura meridiana]|uniref:SH3b domain-containing protein n=1 Tax=Actinomadura meridiana TaxID=559626 RepID=A0ABP8BX44_9ACTN
MQVGVKLGVGVAAAVMAGSALSVGAVAGATEPPPNPGQEESIQQPGAQQEEAQGQDVEEAEGQEQAQPQGEEEGQGSGAIFVGAEGDAAALARLQYYKAQRARWCHGTVVVSTLNVRNGAGLEHQVVGKYHRGTHVTANWSSIVREDGYLWVRLSNGRWIADYILGNGNGKWYVKYSDCH